MHGGWQPKGKKADNTGRGTFLSLNHRPRSVLEALEIANSVHTDLTGYARRLEDEPSGGVICLKSEDDSFGHALSCPLQIDKRVGSSSDKGDGVNPIRIPFSKG